MTTLAPERSPHEIAQDREHQESEAWDQARDDYKFTLATVRKADLGYDDHGIFTAYVHLQLEDGFSQAFGGWGLDDYDPAQGRRVATLEGMQFIIELMRTVGVSEWGQLVGRTVYALHLPSAQTGTIEGVASSPAHVTHKRVFLPRRLWTEE